MPLYKPTKIKNKLTIVIPCYNEDKYIKKTLDSIHKQVLIDGTRVIIADNHSTDRTRAIINNMSMMYSDRLKIEMIDGGKVGEARNLGSDLVNTEYVLFVDADIQFFNSITIHDCIEEMILEDLDLMTCRIKSTSKNWKSKLAFVCFNSVNNIISKFSPFAVGTFFLTKTDKFRELGKFNEEYQHSEDYGLSRKYNSKKFKISEHYVGQDDRRFKKMGYLGMIKLIIKSFLNRKNEEYFKKDIGYW
jgi:glycosyltransferase involved in cell wall biosynthesis